MDWSFGLITLERAQTELGSGCVYCNDGNVISGKSAFSDTGTGPGLRPIRGSGLSIDALDGPYCIGTSDTSVVDGVEGRVMGPVKPSVSMIKFSDIFFLLLTLLVVVEV